MKTEEMTFNDLPKAIGLMLDKLESIEQRFEVLREEIKRDKGKHKSEHIPMNIDEACNFLKMKKATMYYHLQKGDIPATRTGKNYLLFKDELIHWAESGRKNKKSIIEEDINSYLGKRFSKNSFRI